MATRRATEIAPEIAPGIVRYERANVDDARAIAEVHVRSWRWAYRALLPAAFLAALDVDARAALWSPLLADRALFVSVARMTGGDGGAAERIAGFCACGPSRDVERARAGVGEVYAIYVDAERAGRGDGERLLALASSSIAHERFELWVIEENERARRFYENHGFHVDGTAKTDELGGVDVRELRYVR